MAQIERITEHLERPELDDRSYRVIRLPNQLEALLVHDPDTDKASAAVNVNVGNFSDQDDMPGMAHAVEHLLFMGTKKVSLPLFPPWSFVCGGEADMGLSAALVPQGECLQPVPRLPLRFIQCLYRCHRDELFFRGRGYW